MSVALENISKSFGEQVILRQQNYRFPAAERVALVGANGAGKTTLLNMICGIEEIDAGRIALPSQFEIGYLPQIPNPNPEKTVLAECMTGAKHLHKLQLKMQRLLLQIQEHGESTKDSLLHAYSEAEQEFQREAGYALESRAQGILAGLAFKKEWIEESPLSLSGGWRMRLELAKLFLQKPQVLVLDEPTNHLDLPSMVWVESYLRSFQGTLIFVSHDRALLNRLSTVTLHLTNGKLESYKANFDRFLEMREERMAQDAAQLEQLRRQRSAMEDFVRRFGAKATKASQAQSRVKMIAKIKALENSFDPAPEEGEVSLSIPAPQKTPRVAMEVKDLSIGYKEPLASKINLTVERGQKIAVIGANGIGKSTFLKTLAKMLGSLNGTITECFGLKVSYFAQDQDRTLDHEASVLENLQRRSELSERAARTLLGNFLFRGSDVFKKVKFLSGGEKSRVGLCCAIAHQSGLLLLDEPTNHLDMSSVEVLSAALAEYEGTVIFVSHDREFIDSICTHVFAVVSPETIADKRQPNSMIFPGKLEDYSRLAELAGFPNVLAANAEEQSKPVQKSSGNVEKQTKASDNDNLDGRDKKRMKHKVQQRIDVLNKSMEKQNKVIADISAQLAGINAVEYKKLAELGVKLEAEKEKLADLETEWLASSEELEKLQ